VSLERTRMYGTEEKSGGEKAVRIGLRRKMDG
jgi:hypothetical protein